MPWILSVSLLVSALIIYNNMSRHKKNTGQRVEFELTTNVLLTRYPLVFISGYRSIFYFASYWNLIPQFLRDHGFEVIELDLSWRNPIRRQQELEKIISSLSQEYKKLHLFYDTSAAHEIDGLRSSHERFFQSLCLIKNGSVQVQDLKPSTHGQHVLRIESQSLNLADRLTWRLHQWAVFPEKTVQCPSCLGLSEQATSARSSDLYKAFLDHSISLAESDIQ